MICCNAHQGEWIFHDLDIIDCAKLAEILPKVLLLRLPGEAANKQLRPGCVLLLEVLKGEKLVKLVITQYYKQRQNLQWSKVFK